jgi:hypothetical protein
MKLNSLKRLIKNKSNKNKLLLSSLKRRLESMLNFKIWQINCTKNIESTMFNTILKNNCIQSIWTTSRKTSLIWNKKLLPLAWRKKWKKKCKLVLTNKANLKKDSNICNKKLMMTRRSYQELSKLQKILMLQF